MKKRIFSILLTLCMVLLLLPTTVFAASSGSCGTNITWSLDDNGTLTITGTGAMEDWSSDVDVPWHANCSSIKTIVIDPGVTSIGDLAFISCINLTSVTIPNSVTSIGISAFHGCTSLIGVTIPSSVTLIRGGAFHGCTNLTSVTIPSSVTSIGDHSFQNCTGLTSVKILENLEDNASTSIGTEAFSGCTSLTSITIPSSVTSIGHYAFQYCSGLTSVNIKYGVTSIGNSAFYNCTNLESITIPDSVESIDNQAFYYCTNLESITIPANVTSIGAGAFRYCSSLESIFLPDKDNLTIAGNAIPGTSSQIKYILDTEKGEVTITQITLGTDKTSVAIPATICGNDVVAISDSNLLTNISSHTCAGGTATCQTKATCGICKQEYGEIDSSNHNYEKTPAKAATVTETGNIEYWQCKDCKKYFADENGTKEIKLADTVIQKLPSEIIEGKGQTITAGDKNDITFRSNAAFSDFIRVELDGKILDEKNYSVKEGSTIVTLKADYVATLSAGKHTIGIVSTNGTATTTFTVNEKAVVDNGTTSPQTEDNSMIWLWVALLFVSGFGVMITTVYNKEKASA